MVNLQRKENQMGFKIEDLALGKMDKQQFKVDYLPMWRMLDEWDRKLDGKLDQQTNKDIFERIYEFAIVSSGLDKADNAARIENLNKENLKWFTEAESLRLEVNTLRQKLLENQPSKES